MRLSFYIDQKTNRKKMTAKLNLFLTISGTPKRTQTTTDKNLRNGIATQTNYNLTFYNFYITYNEKRQNRKP